MSAARRVWNIVVAVVSIVCAGALVLLPNEGYAVVWVILFCSLIVSGALRVWYYLSMARCMVGGKSVLYLGVIQLDLGLLASSLAGTPEWAIMLYLLGYHLFSGVVDILRAREERRFDAPWKLTLAQGIANVAVVVVCALFFHTPRAVVYLYSAGLVSSALVRIATALRPTAIVYIP